jgi:hypothetical protein
VRSVDHKLPFRTLQVPVALAGAKEHTLVDSGATGYFIDKRFIEKLGLKTTKLLFPLKIRNIDNTETSLGGSRKR